MEKDFFKMAVNLPKSISKVEYSPPSENIPVTVPLVDLPWYLGKYGLEIIRYEAGMIFVKRKSDEESQFAISAEEIG